MGKRYLQRKPSGSHNGEPKFLSCGSKKNILSSFIERKGRKRPNRRKREREREREREIIFVLHHRLFSSPSPTTCSPDGLELITAFFFLFVLTSDSISLKRKTMFCDLIGFCVLFWLWFCCPLRKGWNFICYAKFFLLFKLFDFVGWRKRNEENERVCATKKKKKEEEEEREKIKIIISFRKFLMK